MLALVASVLGVAEWSRFFGGGGGGGGGAERGRYSR